MTKIISLAILCLSVCEVGFSLPSLGLGTVQSAAVRGILLCNGVPSVGTKVKLYDVDTLDLDDLMDEGVTDNEGKFELKGSETEITKIDPKVNIYHKCQDPTAICHQKISIKVPSSDITEGEIPKKTFDAGTINLAGKYSGQSTDCLN